MQDFNGLTKVTREGLYHTGACMIITGEISDPGFGNGGPALTGIQD